MEKCGISRKLFKDTNEEENARKIISLLHQLNKKGMSKGHFMRREC